MISLEQVQQLEERVKRAVDEIRNLRQDNERLEADLKTAEKTITDLQSSETDRQEVESRIEERLLDVLTVLDEVDSDSDTKNSASTEAVESETASETEPLVTQEGEEDSSEPNFEEDVVQGDIKEDLQPTPMEEESIVSDAPSDDIDLNAEIPVTESDEETPEEIDLNDSSDEEVPTPDSEESGDDRFQSEFDIF